MFAKASVNLTFKSMTETEWDDNQDYQDICLENTVKEY